MKKSCYTYAIRYIVRYKVWYTLLGTSREAYPMNTQLIENCTHTIHTLYKIKAEREHCFSLLWNHLVPSIISEEIKILT